MNKQESEAAFGDLFHDIEEPISKMPKVVDEANRFVNYKETDSQIAENQSHIDGGLLDFQFNSRGFLDKDSVINDDTFLNPRYQDSNPLVIQDDDIFSCVYRKSSNTFHKQQRPVDDFETSEVGLPRNLFSFVYN